MWKVLVLGVGLVAPAAALACGGSKACGDCDHGKTTAHHAKTDAAAADPASCAKKAELLGGNCSYTTGMMAQRVLQEGAPYSYTGTLVAAQNTLASNVAAPYTIGPDKVNVVANEVVESITASGASASRLALEGKLLEVEGVKYFVVTGFRTLSS